MPDVNKLMNDKDEKIEGLVKQLELEKEGKKKALNENTRLINEIDDLKRDIYIEEQKNSPEKFQQELETLKKLIKHKDKEIKGFKDSLMKLKEEFFKACDEKLESEKEYQSLQNKLSSQGSNNSQIETKLRLATKKIEDVNGKIRQADAQIEEMKMKEIDWKEKYNTLRQEKERLQDLLDKASRDRQNFKKDKNPITNERVTIEDKNISSFFKPDTNEEKGFPLSTQDERVRKKENSKKAFESNEDWEKTKEERIQELEKELKQIKQSKAPNLIDENGFLKKEGGGIGFKDIKELIESMKEWLKYNPQIELLRGLRENDKKKTGLIDSIVFYSELKINGISLKPRDQTLIDKALKDPKGFLNYIDFIYLLKGMKSSEVITNKEAPLLERKNTLKEKPLTSSEKNVVEVLKNSLVEIKKDKGLLEKQLADWKEKALNYQNQLKGLQNKFPKESGGVESGNRENVSIFNINKACFKWGSV